MAVITPERAGGPNVVAFLDMLAFSEGTSRTGHAEGYDVIVGGSTFTDFDDHPRIMVQVNPTLKSSAAGRYQLLARWFNPYKKLLGLKDFSPLSQDLIAIQMIREQRALPLVQAGYLRDAIAKCANIWASLPGAGYGQREHSYETLERAYLAAGGTLSKDPVAGGSAKGL